VSAQVTDQVLDAGTVVPTASDTVAVSNGPPGVLVQSGGVDTVKSTATFTGPKGPLLRTEASTVRSKGTPLEAVYAGRDRLTTLAELTVCKKPSILIPFPHAADNHQVMNAKSLVDAGAAVMIEEKDLTGEVLADEIRAILKAPERRERMSRAAGLLGSPQAAGEIADVCTELVRRRFGSQRGQDRGTEFRPVRPRLPPAEASRLGPQTSGHGPQDVPARQRGRTSSTKKAANRLSTGSPDNGPVSTDPRRFARTRPVSDCPRRSAAATLS